VAASDAEERPTQVAESSGVSRRPAAHASPAGAPDSLPEEVRLLSKAEQQLSAGRADDALRTLGEHERRFPGGVLAEERLAARVQALCALGRLAEARADLARLAHAYPQSAHLDRARKFCGIDAP
jgi:outer membrane protein assembly factor BamD (BamD/ComL family)